MKTRALQLFTAALAVVLVVSNGCIPLEPSSPSDTTPSSSTVRPQSEYVDPTWTFPAQPSAQPETLPSIAAVVNQVRPAVVSVITELTGYDLFNQAYTQEAAGSGFVIDEQGFIVTNNHVVQDATQVQVEFVDGTTFPASIVGTDPLTDIAVIKIDARGLPYVTLGDSSLLAVGEWLVALGNALGEGISASEGIVSRLDVSITVSGTTLRDLIQTTAAINPGNSGGPLSNMAGEVIGINSVKVASVGVEGMSYAIATNGARPVIQSLINQGYVTRPWLGVSLYTVDRFTATINDLSVDEGALVVEVTAGGPADDAGIEKGDVIVEFDGATVTNIDDLLVAILDAGVGAEVSIAYVRGEDRSTTTARLSESPPPWE